jgi:hypothetical protein
MTNITARPGPKPKIDALAVSAALASGESAYALAERLGVHPTSIYKGRDRARLAVLTEMHQRQSATPIAIP